MHKHFSICKWAYYKSEAELRYFLHHIFAYTIVVGYFSVRQQVLHDKNTVDCHGQLQHEFQKLLQLIQMQMYAAKHAHSL